MFDKFSTGTLLLDMESEIKSFMTSNLSWNCVRIILETDFNDKYKGSDSDRGAMKEKAISDVNIKKRLNLKWRELKKQFPIFEKCPHFAIKRLKVFIDLMIDLYL